MNQIDQDHMARALELAPRGEGHIEPNPMVGCVVAHGNEIVGEGWHERFGGPHAEVEALRAAGDRAAGATMYVTLEPCCHHGKTPPCTQSVIASGVRRVVIALEDPAPHAGGEGTRALQAAGIQVETGLLADQARRVNAPYLKLVETGRPWILAKWAMSLDGKIATRSGDSRWISSRASRAIVHQLRGRMDGIMVGRRTAELDDPLLTARPPGPRVATRIVVDTHASLPLESRLVQTSGEAPLLVAVAEHAPTDRCRRLAAAGCDVHHCPGTTPAERLDFLLHDLGRRHMTNVLVEGGGTLLGSLFDAGHVDEVHAVIAPILLGGGGATPPLAGEGVERIAAAWQLDEPVVEQLSGDIYLHGRIRRG